MVNDAVMATALNTAQAIHSLALVMQLASVQDGGLSEEEIEAAMQTPEPLFP